MDSGKTQQMPNEEPNWQECEHEPVEDAGIILRPASQRREDVNVTVHFCRLCGVVYWTRITRDGTETLPLRANK